MKYGLVGGKLGHSYSPLIHRHLGCPDYALLELPPEEFDAFMQGRDFAAVNVTIPYKKAVIPYCDEIDAIAERIGSVNTLVNGADGKLRGYNTDFYGMLHTIRSAGMTLRGKKVLILGSGGTSLTALSVCDELGAREQLVVSRNGDVDYRNVYDLHGDAEIVINTTPVGMYPRNGERPLDLSRLPKLCGVVDVIYNPLRSALLQQAEALGLPCANGLTMLVAQAKAAAERFYSRSIPDTEIGRILGLLAGEVSNIVVIGMPGSGKSSIGRKVAALSGLRFVDVDEEIVRRAGMSIPDIFAKFGEPHFRDLESEVIAELGSVGGQVISTGGGSVLREKNYAPLHQNGRIYRISRELSALATGGRPLSKSPEELLKMQAEREPHYRAFMDVEIKNDRSIEAAARQILEDFHANIGN